MTASCGQHFAGSGRLCHKILIVLFLATVPQALTARLNYITLFIIASMTGMDAYIRGNCF